MLCRRCFLFCFFNDTATTEIYTLSLHDALPISIFAFGGGRISWSLDQSRTFMMQPIFGIFSLVEVFLDLLGFVLVLVAFIWLVAFGFSWLGRSVRAKATRGSVVPPKVPDGKEKH